MPIYMTARFRVKPDSIERCEEAIAEFIIYLQGHEPGTKLYTSLRSTEDETQYLHYFIFEDEEAEEKHRTSEGVKRFTSILYPELASEGVEFKRYTLVETTL